MRRRMKGDGLYRRSTIVNPPPFLSPSYLPPFVCFPTGSRAPFPSFLLASIGVRARLLVVYRMCYAHLFSPLAPYSPWPSIAGLNPHRSFRLWIRNAVYSDLFQPAQQLRPPSEAFTSSCHFPSLLERYPPTSSPYIEEERRLTLVLFWWGFVQACPRSLFLIFGLASPARRPIFGLSPR